MGERYYITGVQLGMLLALVQLGNWEKIRQILKVIQEEQLLGIETQTK